MMKIKKTYGGPACTLRKKQRKSVDNSVFFLKVFMKLNGLFKNLKVHYMMIIVWRFIVERNDVKCHIGAFENATMR